MSEKRRVSDITSHLISKEVAPRHKVGTNMWGATELVPKTYLLPWRYWQQLMMGWVKGFNDGGPFKAVDIVRAPDLNIIDNLNDATITVNTLDELKPTKAPPGMAFFGFWPTIPAIYDGVRYAGAVEKSRQHRDFGRRSPFLAMTIVDVFKLIIPGSVRSLDVPVWEYQKTAQLVLAEEMNKALSVVIPDADQLAAQNKYIRALDAVQEINPGGLYGVRSNTAKLRTAILNQKVSQGKATVEEIGLPNYPVTDGDIASYLHPMDQIRYVIGSNLVEAMDKAHAIKSTRSIRRTSPLALPRVH